MQLPTYECECVEAYLPTRHFIGHLEDNYIHIVTQWSGSGGIEAHLGDQLASFSALTLLVGLSGLQELSWK